MFVDASAIVAVLNEESGASTVEAALSSAGRITISPAVRYEAVLALARSMNASGAERADAIRKASASVDRMLQELDFEEIAITPDIGRLAIEASARYGKSVGHPAALNFGDCFAYACAQIRGEALLFVGNDFSQTDVAKAV